MCFLGIIDLKPEFSEIFFNSIEIERLIFLKGTEDSLYRTKLSDRRNGRASGQDLAGRSKHASGS